MSWFAKTVSFASGQTVGERAAEETVEVADADEDVGSEVVVVEVREVPEDVVSVEVGATVVSVVWPDIEGVMVLAVGRVEVAGLVVVKWSALVVEVSLLSGHVPPGLQGSTEQHPRKPF